MMSGSCASSWAASVGVASRVEDIAYEAPLISSVNKLGYAVCSKNYMQAILMVLTAHPKDMERRT